MIPETIGRYQIKAELGAGGMGIVYRAYDPHLLRDVALKIIFQGQFRRLSDTKQKQVLGRFLQEAKIIASLRHPAIMPVYDFGWKRCNNDLYGRWRAGEVLAQFDFLLPPAEPIIDYAMAESLTNQ